MRTSDVVEHLHKAGLFGGIVLVPVALAAQSFSGESLVICFLGFAIYVVGLAVFGAGDIHASHPDFARSGRMVCGAAYLVATIASSMVALSPGIKGEIINRYARDASNQLELLAGKPGKSVTLPPVGIEPPLDRVGLVVGSVESQTIRLAPLAIVSEPFLGGMVEWVTRGVVLAFQFAFAVSVLVLLIGIFILPRLPALPTRSGGAP